MSSPFIIIDEIGKKITELKSDISNKLTDTTNGISDIRNNAIGATDATGGTSSAGGIMAKLNKIISDLAGISTNASNANTNALNAYNTIAQGVVRKIITGSISNEYDYSTGWGKTASKTISLTNASKAVLVDSTFVATGNTDYGHYAYLSGNTLYAGVRMNSSSQFTIRYTIIEFY